MAERDPLSGIDGPRPLPAGLRQRLEDRLLQDQPRPIDPALAGRLSATLSEAGAPRPDRRAARVRVAAALAAAGLLVGGAIGLAVDRSASHRTTHTAAGPAATSAVIPPAGSAAAAPSAAAPSAAGQPVAGLGGSSGSGSSPNGEAGMPAGPALAPSADRPVVGTVTPRQGPARGGTWVTIDGSGLAGATAVSFGGTPAARIVVVSPTSVRALTPPHPAGPVPVEVITSGGTSVETMSGVFTFTPG